MTRALIALAAICASAIAHAQAIAPDPTLTPGAVRTSDVCDVCTHGTSQLRHMSDDRRDHILREYGLPVGPHEAYEIDHLIAPPRRSRRRRRACRGA
jgi:hypothetical protein